MDTSRARTTYYTSAATQNVALSIPTTLDDTRQNKPHSLDSRGKNQNKSRKCEVRIIPYTFNRPKTLVLHISIVFQCVFSWRGTLRILIAPYLRQNGSVPHHDLLCFHRLERPASRIQRRIGFNPLGKKSLFPWRHETVGNVLLRLDPKHELRDTHFLFTFRKLSSTLIRRKS